MSQAGPSPFLREFFAAMEEFLLEHPREPARLAEQPGWTAAPARLGIYGRFVPGYVRGALGKLFPACRAMLGDEAWEELFWAFYATRPARHFEINRLGRGFPAFLRERPGLPEYLPALAQFEWHKHAVFVDEAEVPDDVARLSVNPTLVLLEHSWRLCAFYAHRAREEPLPSAGPERGDEVALLWRHPTALDARFLRAGPRWLLVLKLAHEGIDPADAAAAGGVALEEVRAAIASAAQRGLVLLPPG